MSICANKLKRKLMNLKSPSKEGLYFFLSFYRKIFSNCGQKEKKEYSGFLIKNEGIKKGSEYKEND